MTDQNTTKKDPQNISIPDGYVIIPKRDSNSHRGDMIDVTKIGRTVWNHKVTVSKFVIVAILIGVFSVLFGEKEYRSVAMLMPEYNSESSSASSSLLNRYGSLLGINTGSFGSSGSNINVMLYPNIVNSTEFQLKVLYHEFYLQSADKYVTLYDYYKHEKKKSVVSTILSYTIGLPTKFIKLFSFDSKDKENTTSVSETASDNILRLSTEEHNLLQLLGNKINASINLETGILIVSATMPDRYLSAQVTDYVVELLTQYIIDYTVNKEMLDLAFIEEQLQEATVRFETAQEELAAFREQYRGSMSIRNQTEEQRLDSNYQVAFNLYNTLIQQREQAKLRVQEQTPVFNALEKPTVPKSDETSGKAVLILSVILGIISALVWIYVREARKRR